MALQKDLPRGMAPRQARGGVEMNCADGLVELLAGGAQRVGVTCRQEHLVPTTKTKTTQQYILFL